ncbi:MAG TPA: hypothetical protein VK034_32355 [Enhygromyxa sp.]|nr:hypothetical protein [Enhygromyxa sp.]
MQLATILATILLTTNPDLCADVYLDDNGEPRLGIAREAVDGCAVEIARSGTRHCRGETVRRCKAPTSNLSFNTPSAAPCWQSFTVTPNGRSGRCSTNSNRTALGRVCCAI